MNKLVFLLEEPSMVALLDSLLRRLFPQLVYMLVPHQGKGDLEASIPRKLRAWREPGVRFVVVRDNDRAECTAVKRQLLGLCESAGRPDTLVRIVCQELEAWHLGDLESLEAEFGRKLGVSQHTAKFREPDNLAHPVAEVTRLVPGFQKVDGARRMGRRLHPSRNQSESFRQFCAGVGRVSGHPVAPDDGSEPRT